ncbi:hypothetical protein WJX72_010481 [[Myrmecia] bisecta]|uniref:Uncharacterized protein n=1 Tax=[Myrmecia] bisecta TaxID=41462 RepID=A0AAW1PY45_9CHLO
MPFETGLAFISVQTLGVGYISPARGWGPRPAGSPTRQPAEREGAALAYGYRGAPMPPDEEARLEWLWSLDIPKRARTPALQPRFQDITRIICSIFQTPIGGVSLVDTESCILPAFVGIDSPTVPRTASFCQWTLLPPFPEVLIVPDALEDARFRDSPVVTAAPFIRFMAGVPLVAATGPRFGTLCVLDYKPRTLDAEKANLLCNFAEMVVREIERDAWFNSKAERQGSLQRLTDAKTALLRPFDAVEEAVLFVDTSTAKWRIMFANTAFSQLTGMSREETIEKNVWDVFELRRREKECWEDYRADIDAGQEFTVCVLSYAEGGTHTLTLTFRPSSLDALNGRYPHIGIPGLAEMLGRQDGYCFVTVVPMAAEPATGQPHSPRVSVEDSSATVASPGQGVSEEPFKDVRLGPMLGQGAYGRVYRGMWHGAVVAVKIIETRLKEDSNTQAKAVMEAQLTARLVHPNIVQTYKYAIQTAKTSHIWRHYGGDSELEDDTPQFLETWLVMEHCNKGSLQDAVDRGWFRKRRSILDGPPDMAAILATAQEVAAAMIYLHQRDILHGDLSGGNVLLSSSSLDKRGFTAKVADFGLSRLLTSPSVTTKTYGTITHTAPELITHGKLTKAADTYAFGVLLWEMWMGQRPWQGVQGLTIIHMLAIQKKTLQFSAGVPQLYEQLAHACMAHDYTLRPTFEEVSKRLMGMSDPLVLCLLEGQEHDPVPPIRYTPVEWGVDLSQLWAADGKTPAQT